MSQEQEIVLTEDGNRALQEAQNFCWRHHVAIVAAEHVLAGALVVAQQNGLKGLPTRENIEAAVVACIGTGSEQLSNNVMFGSAARDVINETARRLAEAGGTQLGATTLARCAIESGEVGPRFYDALGLKRAELLALLSENAPAN
jgi:hypothetical protein